MINPDLILRYLLTGCRNDEVNLPNEDDRINPGGINCVIPWQWMRACVISIEPQLLAWPPSPYRLMDHDTASMATR